MSTIPDLVQVTAADGSIIAANGKVFRALKEFSDDKKSGQIVLEMKNGVVADVKVSYAIR